MYHHHTIQGSISPSVLTSLRAVLPQRPLRLPEALRLAELQANRLLELSGIDDAPVPTEIVTVLPRITVDFDVDMPCSGATIWDSGRRSWVITLNALEPETRQRFSLLHEYKHIVDHGSVGLVTQTRPGGPAPAEYLADYFAACVLMPKRLVKRAWGEGIQHLSELAELFDVSARAMDIRLAHLGLTAPRRRCQPARVTVARRPATDHEGIAA